MKRREFLTSSMILAAGTILRGEESAAAPTGEKGRIQRYTPLGRTGIRMSDISFGAGKLPAASLILRAIDLGINYFDTAPDYGDSELLIGEAMSRVKQRDKIYIASKYCLTDAGKGHLTADASKADYIAAVEASLKRLRTDYLDLVFVHALGQMGNGDYESEERRLLSPEMLAATEELKKAGKVRHLAMSSHGPHHMERLLTRAVESGHFDVIMPAFNFMKFPKVPEVLKLARERGVGVVAMKTLAGAKEMGLTPDQGSFEHAAFSWALQHAEVAGLVITIKTTEELTNFVHASGQAHTPARAELLRQYAARFGDSYCRTGCDDCEAACPQGVAIATILRHQMYFTDYGDEKRAMTGYARVATHAGGCAACADSPCATACPHGLPVAARLRQAHRTLTFAA